MQRAAQIVKRMIEDSEVKILTDDRELGLFLASTMTRQEVVRLNLGEVVHCRRDYTNLGPHLALHQEKSLAEDLFARPSGKSR